MVHEAGQATGRPSGPLIDLNPKATNGSPVTVECTSSFRHGSCSAAQLRDFCPYA